MGTQIFLGEPPANIKQWIINKYSIRFTLNADGSATMQSSLEPNLDGTVTYQGMLNSDGAVTVQAN